MIVIRVTWLGSAEGPRYHGNEWPPAPLRVFQAMVASAGRRDGAEKLRAFDTLRRVETAPPPTIYAPEARWAQSVASAVPNNDGDTGWQRRAQGLFRKAREIEAKGKTIRRRRGRLVDGPVDYLWDADLRPEDVLVLSELADGVTHVGQGIDLATVTVRNGTCLALAGTAHRPDSRAANLLQVPYPDVLQLLEERYRHERERIRGDGGHIKVADAKRVVHMECGYASDSAVLRNRYATYRLMVGPRTWLESPGRSLAVAAMLRHLVGEAAGEAGLDNDDIAEVMGHGGPGRIHAIPLPNVGHRWADGGVRRVMVASSLDVTSEVWNAIVRRLPGRELKPDSVRNGESTTPRGAEPPVVLEPAEDSVSGRYTAAASNWTTATPVILPGLDHRRGRPRPERATRRLLRFARIPEKAVTAVSFHTVGSIPGTDFAGSVRVPAHLARYPRTHMTVEFGAPVAGPLFLGAGVGWGLGLLAACERLGRETTRGHGFPEV